MFSSLNSAQIAKRANAGAGEVNFTIKTLSEALEVLPETIGYKDMLYHNKELIQPLVFYAKNLYDNGCRIDLLLALFKSITNAILDSLEADMVNTRKISGLMDIFEIQLVGMVFSEQTKQFNGRLMISQNEAMERNHIYQSVLNSFQLMLFIIDEFGNIAECNQEASDYFSIIQGQPYPKLLSLFDYTYADISYFIQTYLTRGKCEIRIRNGELFNIDVKSLGNTSKTSKYIVLMEHPGQESPILRTDKSTAFTKLSQTEFQVCDLIYKGMRNKEIAAFMGIAEDSVKNYRKSIRTKLKISNTKVNLYYYLRENFNAQDKG